MHAQSDTASTCFGPSVEDRYACFISVSLM